MTIMINLCCRLGRETAKLKIFRYNIKFEGSNPLNPNSFHIQEYFTSHKNLVESSRCLLLKNAYFVKDLNV